MIIKTYPNTNLYGKYFLATEAPDDETVTEEQPKPRRNVKVINVRPSSRRKDFVQVTEDEPEETPEENQDTTPTVQGDDTNNESPETEEDTTDFTVGADQDEGTTDTEPDEDNVDFTAGADTDEPDETGETGEDGPVVDDDTDFTAGAEDDTSTDTTQPADGDIQQTTTTDNKPSPPGVEFDSTRKYNLYKEFMSLYNACDNYISKLENILKNDFEENQIIRISVNNLREIKDILSDYMTIRFQINSYVQSLLFYQKMVVAVQLVFDLLKSINGGNTNTKNKRKA